MNYLFIGIGAVLGGLFLCFQSLIPYLAAASSGTIVRKGARRLRVRRDEDPDGFARLLQNRAKSALAGLTLSLAGACVVTAYGLALVGVGAPLSILYIVASLAFGVFALICLIRGFAGGSMYTFWGFAMQGGAVRKQSPIWFWIYALANVVVLLNAGFVLLRLVGGLSRLR